MWPKLTADHKNYADYQANTNRERIPVVILEPIKSSVGNAS